MDLATTSERNAERATSERTNVPTERANAPTDDAKKTEGANCFL